jgi:hypothetical protein
MQEPIGPLCLIAVIVRMRAGEVGLNEPMEEQKTEGYLKIPDTLSTASPRRSTDARISQATRRLASTGVSGRRHSIDILSSEYANLAPQSQHTL